MNPECDVLGDHDHVPVVKPEIVVPGNICADIDEGFALRGDVGLFGWSHSVLAKTRADDKDGGQLNLVSLSLVLFK